MAMGGVVVWQSQTINSKIATIPDGGDLRCDVRTPRHNARTLILDLVGSAPESRGHARAVRERKEKRQEQCWDRCTKESNRVGTGRQRKKVFTVGSKGIILSGVGFKPILSQMDIDTFSNASESLLH
jgi:hypothetical protein